MSISRQKEARSRDYVLLLFRMTSRVLYSAQYHRQHCTLHAFEQFGALYMHNHDDKYPPRLSADYFQTKFMKLSYNYIFVWCKETGFFDTYLSYEQGLKTAHQQTRRPKYGRSFQHLYLLIHLWITGEWRQWFSDLAMWQAGSPFHYSEEKHSVQKCAILRFQLVAQKMTTKLLNKLDPIHEITINQLLWYFKFYFSNLILLFSDPEQL